MKVFITGATGLVGSFICRALLDDGHEIRATRRIDSKMDLIQDIESQVEWIETDLSDAIFWDEYLKDIDAVIHAAALVSFDKRFERKMYKTNVRATADLINAVLNTKVDTFLHVSSVAAIGRNSEEQSITELGRWEDSDFDSIYARAKYLQELEVWRGAEEGLKVKIINPSIVLGPGEWKDSGSTSVFKYAYDEKAFCPAGDINYVDVRDVAKATISLLNSDVHNERFILSAGSVPYQLFFEKVAKAFDKKAPSKTPKQWMLRVAVFAEWIRSRISGNEALITKDTAKLSSSRFHFSNKKIKKRFGFEFKPIDETIAWATDELKKANAL